MFLVFSNHFDVLMSKIILKKHHWHALWHEKLFEKQLQPYCQTSSVMYKLINSLLISIDHGQPHFLFQKYLIS